MVDTLVLGTSARKGLGVRVSPRVQVKIKFLGTSAGWPLPRLGCNCEICTSKDPKDTRTRTQLLVNDKILLDTGPDTYKHLVSNNPQKIEALFISHQHHDHILGLWDISHIYNRQQVPTLYVTQAVLAGIKKIFDTNLLKLKVEVIKPLEIIHLKNTKVTYFPVIHGNTPAFGIKVKESKILAYIPDFNKILPSSQKVIRDCDLLAIDGSSLGKIGKTQGHISIADGIQISKKLKAKQTYFVHIGHKTTTHQSLENYLQETAGSNFHPAHDGLELNL